MTPNVYSKWILPMWRTSCVLLHMHTSFFFYICFWRTPQLLIFTRLFTKKSYYSEYYHFYHTLLHIHYSFSPHLTSNTLSTIHKFIKILDFQVSFYINYLHTFMNRKIYSSMLNIFISSPSISFQWLVSQYSQYCITIHIFLTIFILFFYLPTKPYSINFECVSPQSQSYLLITSTKHLLLHIKCNNNVTTIS